MGEIQQGINQAISNIGIMAALNPTVKKWGETREIGKQQKRVEKAYASAKKEEEKAWEAAKETYEEADKVRAEANPKTLKQEIDANMLESISKQGANELLKSQTKAAEMLREERKNLAFQKFKTTGKGSDLDDYFGKEVEQKILGGINKAYELNLARSKERAMQAQERLDKQNAARREQYARIRSAVNKQMYETGAYKLGKEQQKVVRAEFMKDAKEKDKWLNK